MVQHFLPRISGHFGNGKGSPLYLGSFELVSFLGNTIKRELN
jgi:hypothetical protein